MYLIPREIGLEENMPGRYVELICFGKYQATVHFDQGDSISITGTCELTLNGVKTELGASDYSPLIGLLEESVEGVKISPDRLTLTLRFSNGADLELRSDAAYESFTVNVGGVEYII